MTNYTSTDILNFLNESFKNDTNLVSITMNPHNTLLQLQAGSSAELIAPNSISIEFKDINKSNCFRTVHDSLKDYLKDNAQSFNLVSGCGNKLQVLLL